MTAKKLGTMNIVWSHPSLGNVLVPEMDRGRHPEGNRPHISSIGDASGEVKQYST